MATPMLPRIAMPSAPPSSPPVSEIPEAAPARSGGAELTTRLVVAVNTGASPSDTSSEAPARIARSASCDPPTRVSTPRPTAPKPHPAQDAGRQVGPDDEPDRRRQRPQARPQRRQPQHQLEVLGDEQEVADHDEDAEHVGRQRRAERPDAEQPKVDHRIGQPQLPAREHHPNPQPGQNR